MTENAQNADFRRKPQIFADSPLLLGIQAFGGRRKPQIFAGNRRFSQKTAGNRRLGSVTLGPSPLVRPYSMVTMMLGGIMALVAGPNKKNNS